MDNASLPLFPLNLVLYPGMFLPLHIFEPRYQAMIKLCLETGSSFGVVLIADGTAEGDKTADPYKIGTTAKIVQIQKLGEGRMNIWTVGEERFEVLDYCQTEDGYLLGTVQKLADELIDPLLVTQNITQIQSKFEDYITLMVKLNAPDEAEPEYELSAEPALLSYQVAAILDISSAEKQLLLEMDSVEKRLSRELEILDREIELLQQMLKHPAAPKTQDLPWGGEVNLN